MRMVYQVRWCIHKPCFGYVLRRRLAVHHNNL
ncbi:hypothetical protein OIU84_015618 [Salix udensis]|uniref:Uncharacterized protein n=1 Tax=Salix udensis TaxID=889485 RepID=A0AAD6J7F2_9ROSI|nr:hypothetical protein OIU84_015618 [Salix udensis]